MIERIVIVIFCSIFLILLFVLNFMNRYTDFLNSHLTCHDNEKFLERAYLLFRTYLVLSFLLWGALYFAQAGITGLEKPFEWYVYPWASSFLCFAARAIKTTSFVNENIRGIASKFINHILGLALVGAFLAFIHFSSLWIVNPNEIYKLLYIPVEVTFTATTLSFVIATIFGFPFFFATVGEGVLFLLCRVGRKDRIYTSKERKKG